MLRTKQQRADIAVAKVLAHVDRMQAKKAKREEMAKRSKRAERLERNK